MSVWKWLLGAMVPAAAAVTYIHRDITRMKRTILEFLCVEDRKKVAVVKGPKLHALFHIDLDRALQSLSSDPTVKVAVHGFKRSDATVAIAPALSIDACFSSWFTELGPPTDAMRELGPSRKETVPSGNIHFVQEGENRACVLVMQQAFEPWVWFEIGAPGKNQKFANDLLERLTQRVKEHSVYRGEVLRAVQDQYGNFARLEIVDLPNTPVVVEPSVAQTLRTSLLSFAEHKDLLNKAGLASRRGLLLCGPPGTGKTSTCRYIRTQLPKHTFFLVTSDAFRDIRRIFELAARLAPTIVIIEDVDLVVMSRESSPSNPVLMDLLNAMDGIQNREDVSVILTSNSWEFMERAIVDRPGRIDQVILFDVPGRDHRRAMLAETTKNLSLNVSLDLVADATRNLTPAQVVEVVKRSLVFALERASPADPVLTEGDFVRAIDDLGGRKTVRRRNVCGLK